MLRGKDAHYIETVLQIGFCLGMRGLHGYVVGGKHVIGGI